MARGSVSSGGNREGLSTVAGLAFGPAHSSAEASVIEGERRGRTIRGKFVRATSQSGRDRVSEPKSQEKPFCISKHLVWEAYRRVKANKGAPGVDGCSICLLYTSDAADEEDSVDLGGRRIIKKKKM